MIRSTFFQYSQDEKFFLYQTFYSINDKNSRLARLENVFE